MKASVNLAEMIGALVKINGNKFGNWVFQDQFNGLIFGGFYQL